MVETYNLNINRNEDNIIYHFADFDINVSLSGEKMDPETPEPEPDTEENVENVIYQTPLPEEFQPQQEVQLYIENGTHVGSWKNYGTTNVSQINYKPYIYGHAYGDLIATVIQPTDNLSTYNQSPYLLIALNQQKPNEIYWSVIYASVENLTLANINLPENTYGQYYANTEYTSEFYLQTWIPGGNYPNGELIQLKFIATGVKKAWNGTDPIIWYKIDTGSYLWFNSSEYQQQS